MSKIKKKKYKFDKKSQENIEYAFDNFLEAFIKYLGAQYKIDIEYVKKEKEK